MLPYQDPNAASFGDPASRISINNPLRDASRGKFDPWLLARSEDMTRKLSALQKEYADYQSEIADRAEILWDEMELNKAEILGRRLHSKKPGPVTSALRLTLEGTKLLLREWYAIVERLVIGRCALDEYDNIQALNLMGVGFNSRCIRSELDAPPEVCENSERCAFTLAVVKGKIAKLQAMLPGLERISTKQRQRQMTGQPAVDDKIANRLKREINAAEKNLRWFWTASRRFEAQQHAQIASQSTVSKPIIAGQPTPKMTPPSISKPISQPPASSSPTDHKTPQVPQSAPNWVSGAKSNPNLPASTATTGTTRPVAFARNLPKQAR